MYARLVIAAFALVAFLIFENPATPSHATSFTIDSTTDAVDANPGDGSCASAAGECTLRAAIQETNALPGADTIIVPSGVYTITIPGRDEALAATGDLDITDDLTLTGVGASTTIVGGGALDRVIDVAGTTTTQISGVTITNGDPGPGRCGGGLEMGGTTLTDVVVTNNVASEGGGICGGADSTIVRSAITGNTATSSVKGGGGIYWSVDHVTILDSLIAGNTSNRAGGGIYNYAADITISNTTISGNSTLDSVSGGGGGIVNSQISFLCIPGGPPCPPDIPADLTATNVSIVGNTAGVPGAVGGVSTSGISTARFENSILANNGDANCVGGRNFSLGHNVSSDASCSWTATGDLTNTDPVLGSLQDNGGPTLTHVPLTGSPAIDSGDDTTCPAADQRGVPRPIDGDGDLTATCDRGAVELDVDTDGDGFQDFLDNCPSVANAGQENNVHPATLIGDHCEDPEPDGVADLVDNCPDDANAGQENAVHPATQTGDHCEDPEPDGVMDATDNCPDVANADQDDADSDTTGDACDTGDADGDQLADYVEYFCEAPADDGGMRPERVDGIFAGVSDDGDVAIDEALPAGSSAFDCDGDGYIGSAEDNVYSYNGQLDGDQKTCQEYDWSFLHPNPDVRPSLRWPSDFNKATFPLDSFNKITILDVTSFLAPVKVFGTNVGTNPGDVRWDLDPGPGIFATDINIIDLTAVIAGSSGAPPMLGGAKAMGGPECPWAP